MSLFITIIMIVFTLVTVVAIIDSKCCRPGPTVVNSPAPRKRFRFDPKVKLNIQSIIRWEQLRGKSFSLMDYSDKDDVDALLYTTIVCNNEGKMYTFEVFRHTLSNEKITREMVMALERETAVLAQFQKKQKEDDIANHDVTPGMIGELVATLIMAGLDAHYALEEMELCDLPVYIDAYERRKKEQMESDRLWTYYKILPHIDASKLKNGVRDLITFPWEEMEDMKEAERALTEDAETFEIFMDNGINNYK